jgi:hypothetical protein
MHINQDQLAVVSIFQNQNKLSSRLFRAFDTYKRWKTKDSRSVNLGNAVNFRIWCSTIYWLLWQKIMWQRFFNSVSQISGKGHTLDCFLFKIFVKLSKPIGRSYKFVASIWHPALDFCYTLQVPTEGTTHVVVRVTYVFLFLHGRFRFSVSSSSSKY